MLCFQTDLFMFHRSVVTVMDCGPSEAVQYLAEKYDHVDGRFDEVGEHTRGRCWYSEGDVYVWIRKLDDTPTLVHELIHAAVGVLHCCGIPIDRDHDELICYLTEYLFKEITSSIQNTED